MTKPVLKTVELNGLGGSTPSLSANKMHNFPHRVGFRVELEHGERPTHIRHVGLVVFIDPNNYPGSCFVRGMMIVWDWKMYVVTATNRHGNKIGLVVEELTE